jgi:UDP-N-acetylglucosamine:LPS N-acetylglucosamine transferase
MTNKTSMKICIVSSCGGHLTEARCLKPAYEAYEHFFVLNDKAILPADMSNKTYFIAHSERDWKFFLNLWEAFQILRKERPNVILSTGAGPAVPFAIVGRVFFRTRVLFIETVASITKPSLTGRIMYWLAHDFFYQWKPLKQFFPKAKYGGALV